MEQHEPVDPLPERIDDSRRSALNDRLTLAVGQGRIDLGEFSELSDAVWGITDPAQFGRLEEMISGRTSPTDGTGLDRLAEKAATTTGPGNVHTGQVSPGAPAPVQSLWFGDLHRRGDMQLTGHQGYRLVFGDLDLDLREATLTTPGTVIEVNSVFGDIRITVPPGVAVENRMTLILGDVKLDQNTRNMPGAPTVTVTGRSVFGDLEVRVADPGARPGFLQRLTGL
ncbi:MULTISPECIES: LiaF domain-containing protein [Corynebacterium]|jgi:hypothetical protein|uniref:LiaF domain-containing protein n=1 Tax=Corynebacterium TaxID=1716 RepID=UPI00102FAF97|nr:LiaF domain-containing protein [Corynebacterium neomassiliense]MCI1256430.1 cell wall-active antibiotics response protein [Corynebacterium provencense]